ncbi:hypothetical protein SKAU_G00290500 [Synaphobranchus kaupii]|uniref:Secreted protein n=1 Tax=Synaphobranchus kaupii TaxID=118154 RepID=A0A9Q1ETL7_SYNKA|nr:hypothetical protein SKAU_G00290500 [Synaphobranchus kaupii]
MILLMFVLLKVSRHYVCTTEETENTHMTSKFVLPIPFIVTYDWKNGVMCPQINGHEGAQPYILSLQGMKGDQLRKRRIWAPLEKRVFSLDCGVALALASVYGRRSPPRFLVERHLRVAGGASRFDFRTFWIDCARRKN